MVSWPQVSLRKKMRRRLVARGTALWSRARSGDRVKEAYILPSTRGDPLQSISNTEILQYAREGTKHLLILKQGFKPRTGRCLQRRQLRNAKILKSWLPTDVYIYFVRKGANFYFLLKFSFLLVMLPFTLCPRREQQPGIIKNLTNAVTFKHPKYTKMPTILINSRILKKTLWMKDRWSYSSCHSHLIPFQTPTTQILL